MSHTASIPILARIHRHHDALAITDSNGHYTYKDLLSAAHRIAGHLLQGESDLNETNVAFMATPGFDYTTTLLGIWAAGGIAVPLCIEHPVAESRYVLEDTGAEFLITSTDFESRFTDLAGELGLKTSTVEDALAAPAKDFLEVTPDRRAMILYTSGTTSRPKGVVTTHNNITKQIESLITAWGWSENDRILLFLPLHHVHGIINVLCCSLWAGATCDVLPKFDAHAVWQHITSGKLTLHMAVPTIYVKLIAAFNEASADQQTIYSEAASKLRLIVSGSAALPVTVLEKWETITGHTLLERYGMTEIGMALSNPLNGERRPGFVGAPLPGVTAALFDEQGAPVTEEGQQGEICIQGETVFNEYWHKEEATANSFRDGWFMTGDIAIIDNGSYKILGRNSVDIIKSGGYKISALEIEEVLHTHPVIQECAVVGVPDDEWGERVSVAVVTDADTELELADLKTWASDKLAKYKIPSLLLTLDELPRNVMGKVTKKKITELFEQETS